MDDNGREFTGYQPSEYTTPPEIPPEPYFDLRGARRFFSRVGWAYFVFMLVTAGLQFALVFAVEWFLPELKSSSWYVWIVSMAPMYLVGMPLCLLCLGRTEKRERVQSGMSVKGFFVCLSMCLAILYTLNYATTILVNFLGSLMDKGMTNPLEQVLGSTDIAGTIIFAVIIGPVMEELLFRKILCDRLVKYGERAAVLVSGLIFGLFHGNLSQAIYATVLGFFFAYVYLKTGRIRHTMLLHVCVNFVGSAVPLLLMSWVDAETVEALAGMDAMEASKLPIETLLGVIIYGVYFMAILAVAVIGAVLLIKRRKSFRCEPGEIYLPREKRFSAKFLNAGMIAAVLLGLLTIVGNMVMV